METFPINKDELSESDYDLLVNIRIVSYVRYREKSEERLDWLANNSFSKSERRYFHLYEAAVIAGQNYGYIN